jgi:hypothetical protein
MARASIVSRRDRPEMFAAWEALPAFAAGNRHPVYGSFGRRFYPAVFDAVCTDASFAVARGDEPILLVPCNLMKGTLGYFGMPINLVVSDHVSAADRTMAISAAFAKLEDIGKAGNAASTLLRDEILGPALSELGRVCMAREVVAEVKLHGFCDLTLDEVQLRRCLRKSYQSLINWGRRNLQMVYVNASQPDRRAYDSYRKFHSAEAGRLDRATASWDATYDWIVAGGGELALAFTEDDALVAATVTVDGSNVTYYASGVYDRERFDKPLAHWPLFDAILRSRERGRSRFDLGELPAKGSVSDKEFNIGYFKRGFASEIAMHLVWRLEHRKTP